MRGDTCLKPILQVKQKHIWSGVQAWLFTVKDLGFRV